MYVRVSNVHVRGFRPYVCPLTTDPMSLWSISPASFNSQYSRQLADCGAVHDSGHRRMCWCHTDAPEERRYHLCDETHRSLARLVKGERIQRTPLQSC